MKDLSSDSKKCELNATEFNNMTRKSNSSETIRLDREKGEKCDRNLKRKSFGRIYHYHQLSVRQLRRWIKSGNCSKTFHQHTRKRHDRSRTEFESQDERLPFERRWNLTFSWLRIVHDSTDIFGSVSFSNWTVQFVSRRLYVLMIMRNTRAGKERKVRSAFDFQLDKDFHDYRTSAE